MINIVIQKNGEIKFIYDDQLVNVLDEGKFSINRVSNIEPGPFGWIATMKDNTKLGPFKLRQEALDAEIEYITEKFFSIK